MHIIFHIHFVVVCFDERNIHISDSDSIRANRIMQIKLVKRIAMNVPIAGL